MATNVKQNHLFLGRVQCTEDFYADDEMIITISHMGYIKRRTPLSEFIIKIEEESR